MKFTLLDGGMGQELMARCNEKPTPLWATRTLIDSPEMVQAVHQDYFSVGADVATTNSYAIHRDRLVPFGIEDQFETLQINACEIAIRARDNHGSGLIAGSIGPTGASYRPDLALELEQGAELYAEIAKLQQPYVDFTLLETMSSIKQAHGAVLGARQSGKPVWLSLSVDDDDGTKLRSGENLTDILVIAKELQIDALLINCSIPEAVSSAIQLLAENGAAENFSLGAYANGFTRINDVFKKDQPTVDVLESRTDLDPEAYLKFAEQWYKSGATIIGGCCEVGPAHIARLRNHFRAA